MRDFIWMESSVAFTHCFSDSDRCWFEATCWLSSGLFAYAKSERREVEKKANWFWCFELARHSISTFAVSALWKIVFEGFLQFYERNCVVSINLMLCLTSTQRNMFVFSWCFWCLMIFRLSFKSYERNCVVSINLMRYPTYNWRIMFVFSSRPRMRPDVCRVGAVLNGLPLVSWA